jgi:hypothetical protein
MVVIFAICEARMHECLQIHLHAIVRLCVRRKHFATNWDESQCDRYAARSYSVHQRNGKLGSAGIREGLKVAIGARAFLPHPIVRPSVGEVSFH